MGTTEDWDKDNTHFSHTGAMILAGMIVDDLLTQETGLTALILSDGGPGDIGAATAPTPADQDTGAALSPKLSWTAGANALGHALYFGTTNPPPLVGHLTTSATTTYSPGRLQYGQTYYWQVDAVNQQGWATGNVWSFTVKQTQSR